MIAYAISVPKSFNEYLPEKLVMLPLSSDDFRTPKPGDLVVLKVNSANTTYDLVSRYLSRDINVFLIGGSFLVGINYVYSGFDYTDRIFTDMPLYYKSNYYTVNSYPTKQLFINSTVLRDYSRTIKDMATIDVDDGGYKTLEACTAYMRNIRLGGFSWALPTGTKPDRILTRAVIEDYFEGLL